MRLVAGSFIVVLVLAGAARAATPDQVAADIAAEVMSPYCPGVTLHDCASREAAELRERIARWVAAGRTRAQILDELEAEYGAAIRAAPPMEGSGLYAWVVPALALLAGAGAALVLSRRWTHGAPRTTPISSEERARVQAELARLRRSE